MLIWEALGQDSMIFFLFELIADLIIVSFVYVLAYILKFKIKISSDLTQVSYGNYVAHAQLEPYLHLLYMIILVWVFSLFLFGVYKERKGILSGIEEFLNILKAGLLSTVLIIATTFLLFSGDYSRYVFVYGAILSVIFMFANHQVNFKIRSFFKNLRGNCKKAVVLGTDETAQNIYARIMVNERHNYELLGAFGKSPDKLIYSVGSSFKYLGENNAFLDYVAQNKVDSVFIITGELSIEEVSSLLESLVKLGVSVKFQPSFLDIALGKLESSDDLGMAFFSIKQSRLSAVQFWLKRIFDLFIIIPLFVISSPLFLIIGLVIKVSDGGSVFFVQERVGLNGKSFLMYKFRTMPENIEKETGPVINTIGIADRATLIGKVLRKTSLDEIPQMFNIIKGEMSIVGPRPERPVFVDEFKLKYADYDLRHNVLPGLTGWAQLNGRSALSTRVDEKLMYDLYYINNWSLLFDVKIVIKTLIYVLTWQGAY